MNVAVFIDAANLEHSAQDLGIWVSYRKLKSYLKKFGDLAFLGYYAPTFNTENHRTFLRSLKARGYSVVSKPLKIIKVKNSISGNLRKANFDVEIAVDVCFLNEQFDLMILFSGDSDFAYLVKKIKKLKKEVAVFSMKYHISKELRESCSRYYDLEKLKKIIGRRRIKG